MSEVNHSRKRHPTATGTPLHSPPDPWQSENVEFTGLTEVPLSLIVNVNIGCLLVQFGSAVINRTQSIADAAKDQAGRSTAAVHHNTLQTCWRFGECIRSKLEYEPPPSSSATTPRGEQQKRKFCVNVPDAINRKVICGVGFNDAIAIAVRRIEAANVESGSASGAFKDRWYGAFSVSLVYFFNNNILAIRGLLNGCARVIMPRGSSPGRCLTWADPYHLN
ncbi:hypothetical protein pipiens_020424, partial [Culex pipiens pipiens]